MPESSRIHLALSRITLFDLSAVPFCSCSYFVVNSCSMPNSFIFSAKSPATNSLALSCLMHFSFQSDILSAQGSHSLNALKISSPDLVHNGKLNLQPQQSSVNNNTHVSSLLLMMLMTSMSI